jgi:predicted glycogen debranching enzyme
MLSKLEETLVIEGKRYDLCANQHLGAIHPQGFHFQVGFRLDPFPIFTYEVEGWLLEKSLFMVEGQNTVVVTYELKTAAGIRFPGAHKLEIRPLVAFRDYHSTTHENGALNSQVSTQDGITAITPYSDLPSLYFGHDEADIDTSGYWYRDFRYEIEQERGLDFTEDLFNPFCLTFHLDRYSRPRIMASTEPRDIRSAEQYLAIEKGRRERISAMARAAGDNELVRALTTAADQFIVARGSQKTIIAGYHWFSDWGRDTMIALPGLTLATGRPEVAGSILVEFANHVDRGMLPNRFPDAGETPEYNTVDATLWFFEAVRALLQYTGDYQFIREKLYDVLNEIIDWHVKGTRYNIHVDQDGLLFSGESGVQLTWMDAKVGDWVVTPRHGKPVEIQALWYNALRIVEELAGHFRDATLKEKYAAMAERAAGSFNALFWNEAKGCLYDVVNGDSRDDSVRPNQILAISLKNSMVPQERAERILTVVSRELLTSRGLRTLSPNDSRYRGRYEGSPANRDAVYHQGTVWPWLMGPYITACVKTFGGQRGREPAAEWLQQFQQHLTEACLGQVSEIFDGDAPHTPRGCVAQAWSVAELLRAAVEDVYTTEQSQLAAKAAQ